MNIRGAHDQQLASVLDLARAPTIRSCLSGGLNPAQQPYLIALLAAFELLTALL